MTRSLLGATAASAPARRVACTCRPKRPPRARAAASTAPRRQRCASTAAARLLQGSGTAAGEPLQRLAHRGGDVGRRSRCTGSRRPSACTALQRLGAAGCSPRPPRPPGLYPACRACSRVARSAASEAVDLVQGQQQGLPNPASQRSSVSCARVRSASATTTTAWARSARRAPSAFTLAAADLATARHVGQHQGASVVEHAAPVRHLSRRAAQDVAVDLGLGASAQQAGLAAADLAEQGDVAVAGGAAPIKFEQFGLQRGGVAAEASSRSTRRSSAEAVRRRQHRGRRRAAATGAGRPRPRHEHAQEQRPHRPAQRGGRPAGSSRHSARAPFSAPRGTNRAASRWRRRRTTAGAGCGAAAWAPV